MGWCYSRNPFRSPQGSGGTIASRSPARVDRAGGGRAGAYRAQCPSGPAVASPPAGVLPDRSSRPPFKLFRFSCPTAACGLSPDGQAALRAITEQLQRVQPASRYCADARAFVRANRNIAPREKASFCLLIASWAGWPRPGLPSTRDGSPWEQGWASGGVSWWAIGCARRCGPRKGPGGIGRAKRGRALARGLARARLGEEAFLS